MELDDEPATDLLRPFAHAPQPEALGAATRHESGTVILDRENKALASAQPHVQLGSVRVFSGVGYGLLEDAEDGHLDFGGQAVDRAHGLEVAPDPVVDLDGLQRGRHGVAERPVLELRRPSPQQRATQVVQHLADSLAQLTNLAHGIGV